ncbi:MAG TPA: hypothetical protein VGI03_00485 [Verrucomicrobiae bacterium]|jgi:hypothetical protein
MRQSFHSDDESLKQCIQGRAQLLALVTAQGIELKMPQGSIDSPELRNFCLELALCPNDAAADKSIKRFATCVSQFLLLTIGFARQDVSNIETSPSTNEQKATPYSAIALYALSAFDQVDAFWQDKKRGLE